MTNSSSPSSKPRFNSQGEPMYRRNVWLPAKVWEEIAVLGIEHDESPSEVFERLLRFWIQQHPSDYEDVEI